MSVITDIIRDYNDGNISLEAANAALKDAEAIFRISPREEKGWTEAEMREGFLPGKPSTPAQDKLDSRRRIDLAGQTVEQFVYGARYAVTYDKDGYFASAVKKEV